MPTLSPASSPSYRHFQLQAIRSSPLRRRDHGQAQNEFHSHSQSSPVHVSHRGEASDQIVRVQRDEIQELRREILTLKQTTVPKDITKKRKKDESEDQVVTQGRALPRLVSVYEDIHMMMSHYDECKRKGYHRVSQPPEDELDELDDEELTAEQLAEKRMRRGYTGVLLMGKIMKNIVKILATDEGPSIIRRLHQGAASARSHDTLQVKKLLGAELNKRVDEFNDAMRKEFEKAVWKARAASLRRPASSEPSSSPPPVVFPAPPEYIGHFDINTRALRGLQNDITGCLLCPVQFDWDDIEVRAAVRKFDKDFDFAAHAHARCFYRDDRANPDDLDEGFLQSHLLLQVYRTIFTSPSSTSDRSADPENLPPSSKFQRTATHRADVSQKMHTSKVTPRSIAYAAIHLHFGLTDASSWNARYLGYSYQDLWNFIVDFFEDPEDDEAAKQAEKLLKWWNDRIFTGTRNAANNRGTKMMSRKQVVAKQFIIPPLPLSSPPPSSPEPADTA
ncbi:hypothetical protein DFH05DRAFT_1462884 [Lentinula detonsa]|uniref:Uncharacterized protein n=1 Tax=Lentinula detonsa TaxID=2804962 RepID=A0A9W8NUK7_9AGAR|nr:hypothetical protein DFH05DRAFT_1462884 [Lentinula detonsa]